MHDESVYAARALTAGARGYVTKQQLDETVLIAIRRVLSGETLHERRSSSGGWPGNTLAGERSKPTRLWTRSATANCRSFG